KTSAFSGMTAKVEMRTRDGELRYQFADEEPSVYAWDSARLTADLQGEKLEGVFMMDWSDYGEVRATTRIDFVQEDIVGEVTRSEEHTSELQSRENLVCRLLLEKNKTLNQTLIRN